MRKALIIAIAALLVIGVTGVFLTTAFFGHIPIGEPRLKIEFYPQPPWRVRLGDSLEVTVGVANDAWLLAWAEDIRATVFVPEGFTITQTGTKECEIHFGSLHGQDGFGNGFTVRASNIISPGNYTVTIKVSGDNVAEKIFTPQVIVLAL
jgi:hypothetical protein